MTESNVLIAIIGVLGTISSGFFAWLYQNKQAENDLKKTQVEKDKSEADALKSITDATHALIAPQTERINQLESRLDGVEIENDQLKKAIVLLKDANEAQKKELEIVKAKNVELSNRLSEVTEENDQLRSAIKQIKKDKL